MLSKNDTTLSKEEKYGFALKRSLLQAKVDRVDEQGH